MNRNLAYVWVVLGGVGCQTPIVDGFGYELWNLFAFDGERTWEWEADDGRRRSGRIEGSAGSVSGDTIYTVSYEESGAEVLRLQWSSSGRGVYLHDAQRGGAWQGWTESVQLSGDTMTSGEQIVSEVDGSPWTSTFVGIERCPTGPGLDWRCGVWEVHTEAEAGAGIAGNYYAARGHNVVAMELDGVLWRHESDTCTGDCDGRW